MFAATLAVALPLSYVMRSTIEAHLGSSLAALADNVCDGTTSPLVYALVRGRKFSTEEIAHFRKLLDDLTPKD